MIGTVLAVLAAVLLGGSSVAQRRGMPPAGRAAGQGLLAGLLRRGWWWGGTAASIAGLGLQLLALYFGSIIVVQTVLTSSIAWTTLVEWALLGRRPTSRAWAGVTLTGTGLLMVLLALAPSTGPPEQTPSAAVTNGLAGLCAVVMGAAVVYARRASARGRALGLAVATGVGYGMTAVALKTTSVQVAASGLAVLAHPALWIAVSLGPLSVLLSQHALQAGRAVIAVVSVILVVDPVIGLAAGTLSFGERVATTPTAITTAIAGGLALVAGMAAIQSGTTTVTDRGPRRRRPGLRPLLARQAILCDVAEGYGGRVGLDPVGRGTTGGLSVSADPILQPPPATPRRHGAASYRTPTSATPALHPARSPWNHPSRPADERVHER